MPVYDFAGNLAPLDKMPQKRQPKTWDQLQAGFGGVPPQSPTNNTGPVPFNLNGGDDWGGWRLNNWALQYDTLPWVRDSILFARKMQPQRQEAILSLIRALQNREGTAAAFRQQQSGSARDQGRRLGMALAAQGGAGSQSQRRGAMLEAMNRGADASSAFDAHLQSPQGRQEALQAILQALSMAADPAALNAYQGITGTTLGVEGLRTQLDQIAAAKKGSGLGGILGGLLGTVTSGGWGSILGALSGGAGGGGYGNPDGAGDYGWTDQVQGVRR